MKISRSLVLVLTLFSLTLTGCNKKKVENQNITPAKELYKSGLNHLEAKNYKLAAEQFEQIFFQHPGNEITPQAELMQAYSLYLGGEYDEVVDILDIFIKLHPRHKDIAYAYYLKALANYVQISNIMLDQSRTKYAKEGFAEVIRRFPGSKYAIEASLKMDLINAHLAGKEMLVGRYYLKKKNPIAAIKRFQMVVQKYDTTEHVAEALHRLVESNLMLGLVSEAEKYAAILGHNYPQSSWYQDSYNLLKIK